jgi:hypothetical protein
MFRGAIAILLSFVVVLAVLSLLVSVESAFLENWWEVAPFSPQIRQSDWLETFRETSLIGVGIAFFAVLVWTFWSYWQFRIERWKRTDRAKWDRRIISAVLAASILAVGAYFIEQTHDWGKAVAIGFYVLNTILIYYLPTAIFSPSSVKYVPLWSKKLASIGNLVRR